MVSLATNLRNSKLTTYNSNIIGRFGFSLNEKSILNILFSFYNFYKNYNYQSLFIGYDGTDSVDSILNEIVIPILKEIGLISSVVDKPSSLPQFSWFCTQSNKKTIGIYISSSQDSSLISFKFINNKGLLLESTSFKSLLKSSCKLTYKTIEDYEDELEYTDIDGYFKFLKDNKLLNRINKTINLDTMFGSSFTSIKPLTETLNWTLIPFNLQSDSARLKNYVYKPTGNFLEWFTTYNKTNKDGFYFGLDNTGSYLGVYDLIQKLEIRPTSIGILLINYLKQIEKKENALICITPAVGLNLINYIKKEKYKYKLVSNLEECLKLKDRVDLYIDESGGYYFGVDKTPYLNPYIAMYRVCRLCEEFNKSPGQILDSLFSSLKRLTFHGSFCISLNESRFNNTLKYLTSLPDRKNKKIGKIYTNFMFKNSRVVLKKNVHNSIIEVYIEAYIKEDAEILSKEISNLLIT